MSAMTSIHQTLKIKTPKHFMKSEKSTPLIIGLNPANNANKKAQLSLTNPLDVKAGETMPKIAPIRRPCNVVADNTGLSSFD